MFFFCIIWKIEKYFPFVKKVAHTHKRNNVKHRTCNRIIWLFFFIIFLVSTNSFEIEILRDTHKKKSRL